MKVVVRVSEGVKEVFEGDNLSVRRVGSDKVPLIEVTAEGDGSNGIPPRYSAQNILASFQTWEYWVLQGEPGAYARTLKEIRNIITSENPPGEQVHFIEEELEKLAKIEALPSLPPA